LSLLSTAIEVEGDTSLLYLQHARGHALVLTGTTGAAFLRATPSGDQKEWSCDLVWSKIENFFGEGCLAGQQIRMATASTLREELSTSLIEPSAKQAVTLQQV
jgi:hypothetical protein